MLIIKLFLSNMENTNEHKYFRQCFWLAYWKCFWHFLSIAVLMGTCSMKRQTFPNGSIAEWTKKENFFVLSKIRECPCDCDGKSRTVYVQGLPNIRGYVKAQTRVRGRVVSGFIHRLENGYVFKAMR